MKIYNKVVIDSSDIIIEEDSYEYEGPLALANPSGGGGGKGDNSMNVTQTTTNPVVPDDMKALADSMNAIATGNIGAPANLGPIPGLDAPRSGPLVPQPSMGSLYGSAPFQMGANGMNVMGRGRRMGYGGGRMGMLSRPMPRSWGDLFSMTPSSGLGGSSSNGMGIPSGNGGILGGSSFDGTGIPSGSGKPLGGYSPYYNMPAPQPSQDQLARMAGA